MEGCKGSRLSFLDLLFLSHCKDSLLKTAINLFHGYNFRLWTSERKSSEIPRPNLIRNSSELVYNPNFRSFRIDLFVEVCGQISLSVSFHNAGKRPNLIIWILMASFGVGRLFQRLGEVKLSSVVVNHLANEHGSSNGTVPFIEFMKWMKSDCGLAAKYDGRFAHQRYAEWIEFIEFFGHSQRERLILAIEFIGVGKRKNTFLCKPPQQASWLTLKSTRILGANSRPQLTNCQSGYREGH